MADSGWNFSTLINSLDDKIASATPKVDFSAIGNLPDAYQKGFENKQARDLANAFKGGVPKNPDGSPNYGEMAKTLYQLGSIKQGTDLSNLDIQRQGLARQGAYSDAAFPGVAPPPQPSLPNTGSSQPSPAPQQAPSRMPAPGPVVQSSPRVVGDREGVDNGTYDAPTAPGQRPPVQPDPSVNAPIQPRPVPTQSIQPPQAGQPSASVQPPPPPNAQVQNRFPNPSAPVSPMSAPVADPTLGGLVPRGRTPEQQIAILRRAATDPMMAKDKVKAYTDAADNIEKAIGQLREAGLKERQSVLEPAVKAVMDRLAVSQTKADSIADGIMVSHDLLAQLDSKSGVFSGQWANQKLSLAKIGRAIGLDVAPDQITNTEAFSALVGKKVAQTVKAFGSGTSITNQDREYAAKMEAGDIKLDESSMRRIIGITDKINRGVIDKHNKQVEELVQKRPELQSLKSSLLVTMPPDYSRSTPQYKEGQTATNQQTGQRLQFRNGQWQALQ